MSVRGLVTASRAPWVPADAAPPQIPPRSGPVPAEGLLHPVSLLALVVLLLNDHVLKGAWPGPLTGKLSDLAGLVVFPVIVVGAWEVLLATLGRWRGPTDRSMAVAVVGSGLAFALVKTIPAAALAAGWLMGLLQWLLSLPVHAVTGSAVPPVLSTTLVVDPTDLVALPCLAGAAWIGRSRLR